MGTDRPKPRGWASSLIAVGFASLAPAGADESQHPVLTTLSSTTLSGYVDTSAILNFGSAPQVVGRTFDGTDKQDGINLDVVKLQLDKPLTENSWSAGYRLALMFGPDANTFGSASGGLIAATSDFAVRNAYVALRAPIGNGLDLKFGTWDTVLGYEVTDAGANPNFSRSFAFYIEPVIHTGLLATYPVRDWLSVSAGVADPNNVLTNPSTINARSSVSSLFTYLGSFTLTAPKDTGFLEGAALTGAIIDHGIADTPDVVQYYLGATMPTPIANLTLGLAYDYRGRSEGQGADSLDANAVGGYLMLKASEKLKLATRIEYATGAADTWYAPKPGQNNELLGLTFTLDYSIWANVISRLEFRWDRDLTGTDVFGTGNSENATSLALNVIYSF